MNKIISRIRITEKIIGKKQNWSFKKENRMGFTDQKLYYAPLQTSQGCQNTNGNQWCQQCDGWKYWWFFEKLSNDDGAKIKTLISMNIIKNIISHTLKLQKKWSLNNSNLYFNKQYLSIFVCNNF